MIKQGDEGKIQTELSNCRQDFSPTTTVKADTNHRTRIMQWSLRVRLKPVLKSTHLRNIKGP